MALCADVPLGSCLLSHECMCFSVKFVGLFVILLIGVSTVAEFWQLLGDLTVPMVSNHMITVVVYNFNNSSNLYLFVC